MVLYVAILNNLSGYRTDGTKLINFFLNTSIFTFSCDLSTTDGMELLTCCQSSSALTTGADILISVETVIKLEMQ